jgi:hypothetical protein
MNTQGEVIGIENNHIILRNNHGVYHFPLHLFPNASIGQDLSFISTEIKLIETPNTNPWIADFFTSP